MSARRRSFFFKHILVSTLATWLLIALGTLAAAPLVVRLSIFKPDLNGHQVKAIAEVFQASIGDRSPESVVEGMPKSTASSQNAGGVYIADENGQILAASSSTPPDFKIEPRYLPRAPLQVAALNDEPPSPGEAAVILLSGKPARYLIFQPRQRPGPEQFMMVSILGVLTIVIFVAMGLSSFILLRKLRRHASEVAAVMDRLQSGELGSRLEIARMDEFGELMHQFNLMAGDVERLFNRVRETEKARIHLLQDIGHDLRTPLSSLLSLFEILRDKFDKMPDSEKKQFLATGRREIKFTQRLVDDLLFLARVEDPACLRQDQWVDLSSLLLAEIDAKRLTSSLEISSRLPEGLKVLGDSQLLSRLARNALDNAISYAERSVVVSVTEASQTEVSGERALEIHFDDDGPGFSEGALLTFGQKRPTRIQHSGDGDRISLGLGSVIMVAVARLYSGAVVPSNRTENSKVTGGRISVRLHFAQAQARTLKSA